MTLTMGKELTVAELIEALSKRNPASKVLCSLIDDERRLLGSIIGLREVDGLLFLDGDIWEDN
jgi:hypothetical protein